MKGHLLALAGGLPAEGYQLEVACPANSALATEIEELGLTVHHLNLVGPLNLRQDLLCIRQLQEIIRRGRYDLVHCHGSKAGLVGRIAAVLAGCRHQVLTVHNFIAYDEVSPARRIMYRYGEKLLSRVTSRIITVSRALKDDLATNFRIPPAKITHIYNGIDASRYLQEQDKTAARASYGIAPGQLVVGTLARMAPQKGLNYLVEAIPLVNAALSRQGKEPGQAADVFFIIAGEGPLRPELEELASRLGVRDRVLFPGYVQDIRGLFACFDLFVIPSIAEGLSITTIEAMASGLPVVAAAVGGLPELVRSGETGYLVRPRDAGELAAAVVRLLTDPPARIRFGLHGRLSVGRQFSIDRMLEETKAVYDQVLGL